MRIQNFLMVATSVVTVTLAAEVTAPIPLQRSDYNKSDYCESSFTNMVNTIYGWDDPVNGKGAAPRSDADYLVSDGNVLCTPYDSGKDGDPRVYVFGGRSLTIDGSKIYVRSAQVRAKVQFDDLRIVGESQLDNQSWSYDSYLLGALSLQSGATLGLSSGGTGHHWYFDWTVVGGEDAVITETGWSDWMTNKRSSYLTFTGDTSGFEGTVQASNRIFVELNGTQEAFPGNIWVMNNSGLSVVANSAKTTYVVGDVVSSNSSVTVSANRTLNVRSLVSGGSETNNLVTVARGGVLEVGELVVDGTKFDLSGGGVVNVTGGIVAIHPAVLVPPATNAVLVTMPLSAGTLKVSDFTVAGTTHILLVKTEGDLQRIYGIKQTFDATTGYVVLEKNESSGASTGSNLAYDSDGILDGKGWSDKTAPHPETNYFSDVVIRTKNAVFQGDSLTIGGKSSAQLRVVSDFTINDLRMIGPSEWSTSGGNSVRRCKGVSLSVMTTQEKPLKLTGGVNGQYYQIESALHGSADAWISCAVSPSTVPGDGRQTGVWLLGDNADYAGTIWVAFQTTLALGSSMPGAVVLGSTNETQAATLTTRAAKDAVVSIGSLSSDVLGVIDIPATNTLCVINGLAVTKTLSKVGAGMLVLDGVTTAASGAQFTLAEGSLKPVSGQAIGTLPITFAEGTSVRLDWNPSEPDVAAKGLDLSRSTFTIGGTNLLFTFDDVDLDPCGGAVIKALVTVKDADAVKLEGRISVGRVSGFTAQVQPAVTAGGVSTYSVKFAKAGLFIFFK